MLEIYFETYGCTANVNSTEIMKGLVKEAGLNLTEREEFADIIVINSCIVKEPTEEKIRRRIEDLLEKYPDVKIILAGCMANLRKNIFDNNRIYFLESRNIKSINSLIKDIQEGIFDNNYLVKKNEVKANLSKVSKEKYIGITQISEGCLGECNYCITRMAKGKLFSYPIKQIVESVKRDVEAGSKEIWLTSQDCANYGNENGEYLLPKLLREILKIKGKFHVRLGMSNPNNILQILDELIEIYKDEKMFKFLHLPIQSGSNKILKKMGRNYTKEDVEKILKKFRENFKEMHISTDIIVGYPGETKKDFEETRELFLEMKPETVNVSKFWPRKGTLAAKEKQLDREILKERAIELLKLHKEICNNIQKDFLEKEKIVYVSQKGFENSYLARDENYKLYAVFSNEKILGKKIRVKIKKITPHYLISEVINDK